MRSPRWVSCASTCDRMGTTSKSSSSVKIQDGTVYDGENVLLSLLLLLMLPCGRGYSPCCCCGSEEMALLFTFVTGVEFDFMHLKSERLSELFLLLLLLLLFFHLSLYFEYCIGDVCTYPIEATCVRTFLRPVSASYWQDVDGERRYVAVLSGGQRENKTVCQPFVILF